jgi:hypothetical protein
MKCLLRSASKEYTEPLELLLVRPFVYGCNVFEVQFPILPGGFSIKWFGQHDRSSGKGGKNIKTCVHGDVSSLNDTTNG